VLTARAFPWPPTPIGSRFSPPDRRALDPSRLVNGHRRGYATVPPIIMTLGTKRRSSGPRPRLYKRWRVRGWRPRASAVGSSDFDGVPNTVWIRVRDFANRGHPSCLSRSAPPGSAAALYAIGTNPTACLLAATNVPAHARDPLHRLGCLRLVGAGICRDGVSTAAPYSRSATRIFREGGGSRGRRRSIIAERATPGHHRGGVDPDADSLLAHAAQCRAAGGTSRTA